MRGSSIMVRFVLLAVGAALVTASATAPVVATEVPSSTSDAVIAITSPVRCNKHETGAAYTLPPVMRLPRSSTSNQLSASAGTAITVTGAMNRDQLTLEGRAKQSQRSARQLYNRYGIPYPQRPIQTKVTERYNANAVASINTVAQAPVSTFSVDVDTGAYANVRRFLTQGQTPPAAAVRTEELLNYFRYDYPLPADRAQPFSVTTDVSTTPWNEATRLLRIGIRGYDLPHSERPAANLVFLIDVSGSMNQPDKLPLVKSALGLLANRLSPQDKVSIVVYAGAAGIVLEPTSNARYITEAIDCLSAGGSTAGGRGMELAYATARANFIKGGVNRVIMATDGDFNVGISSTQEIEMVVKANRDAGITLTCLGFGQGNFNEAMMERIADVGNGNYAYIDSTIEAQKVLDDEMAATLFTIAKDVKIQIEFNPQAVSQYRLIGYENRALAEEDFANDAVDAGDIGAGHQVTALYEIVPAGAKGWLPDRRYGANPAPPSARGKPGELAWLKLRYKLPDGDTSSLIETPIDRRLIDRASAPRGDMAFAVAVAAYGQKLRSDKYLGSYGFDDARRLAGDQRGYLREEFIKLARLAHAQQPVNGGQSGLR